MPYWIVPVSFCLVCYWIVFRPRRSLQTEEWTVETRFRPTEPMSRGALFGCLLSGHLAVLERDNFGQLPSALPVPRIRGLLQQHWGIASVVDCQRVIHQRMKCLGDSGAAEDAAYKAWRDGVPIATMEYRALANVCWFLVNEGGVMDLARIRRICSAPLSCDIEQTAYLVRLAVAVGFLERDRAVVVLRELTARARTAFESWEDYSLAALIGKAVRTRSELTDDEEWRHIVQSHRVFLAGQQAAFLQASDWSSHTAPLTIGASKSADESRVAPMGATAG